MAVRSGGGGDGRVSCFSSPEMWKTYIFLLTIFAKSTKSVLQILQFQLKECKSALAFELLRKFLCVPPLPPEKNSLYDHGIVLWKSKLLSQKIWLLNLLKTILYLNPFILYTSDKMHLTHYSLTHIMQLIL